MSFAFAKPADSGIMNTSATSAAASTAPTSLNGSFNQKRILSMNRNMVYAPAARRVYHFYSVQNKRVLAKQKGHGIHRISVIFSAGKPPIFPTYRKPTLYRN